MALIPATASCDQCGKKRTDDSNHWFNVDLMPERISIKAFEIEYAASWQSVCGAGCLAVAISELAPKLHATRSPAKPISNRCKCGHLYTEHVKGKWCVPYIGNMDKQCACVKFEAEEGYNAPA